MDRTDVKKLSLFAALRERTNADVDAILDEITTESGRDPRRTYRGAIRVRVYERDGGRCVYCGSEIEITRSQIDHIIPWSKGGRTTETNAALSCGPCNRHKSARVW